MMLAKVAYDAYVKKAGGVSLATGDKLPEFNMLKQAIRDAWEAAAAAVEQEVKACLDTSRE